MTATTVSFEVHSKSISEESEKRPSRVDIRGMKHRANKSQHRASDHGAAAGKKMHKEKAIFPRPRAQKNISSP